MRRIYNISLILFILAIISDACKYEPLAFGSERQIYVFADSLFWTEIKSDIENTFYSYVYTPRAEQSFFVTWKPLRELNSVKDRMNLFFISTTDKKNQVNNYVNKTVPAEFLNNVSQNKVFYFFKDNLFAKGQISMFMIASDKENFKQNFNLLEKDIFQKFKNKYDARLKYRMFEKGEQFDMEEFLASEYGYKIKVQHDYFLATQNPDEKYVWLRRIDPDRWISIWRINADSALFNKDSLINIRNTMTKKYYDGDVVVAKETNLGMDIIGKKEVYKLTGTWRNDSLIVGGPFRMFAIPNDRENALYLLDIAVMAPSKDKKPFLDQLEIIAHTFTFVDSSAAK